MQFFDTAENGPSEVWVTNNQPPTPPTLPSGSNEQLWVPWTRRVDITLGAGPLSSSANSFRRINRFLAAKSKRPSTVCNQMQSNRATDFFAVSQQRFRKFSSFLFANFHSRRCPQIVLQGLGGIMTAFIEL